MFFLLLCVCIYSFSLYIYVHECPLLFISPCSLAYKCCWCRLVPFTETNEKKKMKKNVYEMVYQERGNISSYIVKSCLPFHVSAPSVYLSMCICLSAFIAITAYYEPLKHNVEYIYAFSICEKIQSNQCRCVNTTISLLPIEIESMRFRLFFRLLLLLMNNRFIFIYLFYSSFFFFFSRTTEILLFYSLIPFVALCMRKNVHE